MECVHYGHALYDGAKDTLLKSGVQFENIKQWNVPGSFELIYGLKKAQAQKPNAVIAIGSIIQGETKHFDFVCNAVVSRDQRSQYSIRLFLLFFVCLQTIPYNKHRDRSGGKHGNKGVEAAVAALQMANLQA